MFGLVRDIRTKISPNNAMPCWVVFLIELFLDISSNVLERKSVREMVIGSVRHYVTFSILYFSNACDAQSTASCCISSDMSALLITALRSAILSLFLLVSRFATPSRTHTQRIPPVFQSPHIVVTTE
jgi:hypothetical protein